MHGQQNMKKQVITLFVFMKLKVCLKLLRKFERECKNFPPKILGARTVKWSTFHTESPQRSGAKVENSVTRTAL
jgi:hypothetical protein